MSSNVLVIEGDGIGQEIIGQARNALDVLNQQESLNMTFSEAMLGGRAYDQYGHPYPEVTQQKARAADAILFGACGGPKWDGATERHLRPEQGLLDIRADLDLFANFRPAIAFPQLVSSSPLKPEKVAGLDLLIIRELTGGIYFGQPRGIRTLENGERQGFNTDVYSESEVRRIAKVAFEAAMKRNKRVCSVDKANVLEVTVLWREMMEAVAKDYPEVTLTHLYVDNAAMQLVVNPKQFDVIVTGNLFGDILSDEASMITGSIGMLPSASLNEKSTGFYEPIHGSAPDIAGKNIANPLATIMSAAMMLRYSLAAPTAAERLESAVSAVLDRGFRTGDIWSEDSEAQGHKKVSCSEMGDAVVSALKAQ
ncbi:3-isopropylmalate dehydrogenase [Marinibactrum halimedae]|uniref:3-isopropylmalate dehydrogenase n=1 Tax=Marinibactrum halimedae TaxID=1444977 RepID=A0AA37WNE8_9GAMM|nr:3-isopropylmalate dehydrogenase [Marinibactrum halimedae]MCD9459406.1 3-isopropylmalate dehydrogenase [Marinibactrum halimedae]GLS27528.1 3-isopropylmalate dehydrogenase [Marinibactrum halimedae]